MTVDVDVIRSNCESLRGLGIFDACGVWSDWATCVSLCEWSRWGVWGWLPVLGILGVAGWLAVPTVTWDSLSDEDICGESWNWREFGCELDSGDDDVTEVVIRIGSDWVCALGVVFTGGGPLNDPGGKDTGELSTIHEIWIQILIIKILATHIYSLHTIYKDFKIRFKSEVSLSLSLRLRLSVKLRYKEYWAWRNPHFVVRLNYLIVFFPIK